MYKYVEDSDGDLRLTVQQFNRPHSDLLLNITISSLMAVNLWRLISILNNSSSCREAFCSSQYSLIIDGSLLPSVHKILQHITLFRIFG
jgi:hypothetical protein